MSLLFSEGEKLRKDKRKYKNEEMFVFLLK